MQKSTIANSSSFFGGGIFNDRGTVTVESSSLIGNHSIPGCCGGGTGGGIYNYNGNLTVENSTFNGNSAPQGGAIFNDGAAVTATVTNSTISGNTASSGGGIWNNGGTVGIENTIVSGNGLPNCIGVIGDLGYNLEHAATNCGFSAHAVTGDPLLGGPASNGGKTPTMALAAGSAAIGAGSPGRVPGAGIGNLDQRGKPRRADQRGVCDIGAFDTGAGALSAAKDDDRPHLEQDRGRRLDLDHHRDRPGRERKPAVDRRLDRRTADDARLHLLARDGQGKRHLHRHPDQRHHGRDGSGDGDDRHQHDRLPPRRRFPRRAARRLDDDHRAQRPLDSGRRLHRHHHRPRLRSVRQPDQGGGRDRAAEHDRGLALANRHRSRKRQVHRHAHQRDNPLATISGTINGGPITATTTVRFT